MSLDLYVALNRRDLPTAEDWAATARSHGLTLNLDTSLSPNTSVGYWPCPDAHAGFEYSIGPLDQAEADHLGLSAGNRKRLRPFDSLAVLSCRSDKDFAVAQCASAVIAKRCNGLVIDGESAAVMTPDQAIDWVQGRYEPPPDKRRPAFLPKRQVSAMTWARLGLLVLIASFWLIRWATGI